MWQYLAQETLEEIKFRRNIQEQIKATMAVRNFVKCLIIYCVKDLYFKKFSGKFGWKLRTM